MSVKDCLTRLLEITQESGLKLSRANLEAFAHQLEAKEAGAMSKQDFALAAQGLFDEQIKRFADIRKAERVMNMVTVKGASIAIRKGSLGGTDIVDNFRNFLHGGALRPSEGGRIDPYRVAAGISKGLQNFWDQGVRPYKETISRRFLIDEIFQERDAINRGIEPGKSGSAEAVAIARVMHGMSNQIFDLKKAFNPYMEKNAEFLANRFHDREKVSATDKPVWVADMDRYFGERSFPDASPEEKIQKFENIYDRIKDGTYGTVSDAADEGKYITGDSLRANILRRMARGRKLMANDWKAEADYFKKYGPETIGDLMGRVIDRSGKDIATLSKFGSTPHENYRAIFSDILARATPEQRDALKSSKSELDGIFRQVTGDADAPARNGLGKITKGLLNAQYAAKTGMSYFRMLSDLGTSTTVLRGLNGKNVMENSFDVAAGYFHAFASTEHRERGMRDLHLFATSARASIMGGVGAPGSEGGGWAWAAEKVGVLGQHQRHVEAMKVAVGSVIARDLGRMAEIKFEALPVRMKNGLKAYGIGEHEWNLLRKSPESWGDNGALAGKFMTPDGVAGMPDEAIEIFMRKSGTYTGDVSPSKDALFLARKKVEFAIGNLINDHADFGSTTAGSRQRAFMYAGTDVNSREGAARRILFQFKSAALTSMDAYRRMHYAGGGPRGDWAGVAQGMAAVMFWWGVGEYAKQVLTGKTPEDFKTPDFALRALVASGAGGLYADVIQSAARQNGVMGRAGGAVLGMAGPVVSESAAAIGLAEEYVQKMTGKGQSKFPNRQLLSFVQGNVPMQNLMGAKGVLDHYVMNGIKEFLDVGYLAHLEQNVTRTPGLLEERQRYWAGKPTESIRFGR